MLGNERGSSEREKIPSLMRPNNDQGRRSKEVSPKLEHLSKNNLKEKYLNVPINLRAIEALMKKQVPPQKDDQKSRRNDINLE